MRKLVRLSALGAFFVAAIVALSACGGGGIPGNSVAKVGDQPVSKDQFDHWMLVAATQLQQQAGTTGKVVIPQPPDFTACAAAKKAAAPKPAKGQPTPDRRELQGDVQDRVRPAARLRHAVPDLGGLDPGRDEGPGPVDHRQGRRQAVHDAEEGVVPEGVAVQDLPQELGNEPRRRQVPREGRRAVDQAAQQDHQGHQHGDAQGDRGLLRQEQGALLCARAPRPADRADQDRGRRPTRPRPPCRAARAGRRSPRRTRSTRAPRARAACCSASPRAPRRRRSTPRSSRPRPTRCSARSRPSSASTSSRSRRSTRRAADGPAGDADDQVAARGQPSSRRPSTRS